MIREDLQQAAERLCEKRDKWFDEQERKEQEPKYCDRNICLKNEYNNIGCDECEVTKSQEPSGDLISRQAVMDCFKKWQPYMATRLWEFEQELSALPSVSPQPCEDAISRQALLKLMGEEPFNWTDSNQELQAVEDYRNFRNMVEQLPSVKPQEKTGHWIYKTMEGQFCSICDEQSVWKFNYCPYCGARMVEPQESEDI